MELRKRQQRSGPKPPSTYRYLLTAGECPWKVQEELGKGGYGVVYKVRVCDSCGSGFDLKYQKVQLATLRPIRRLIQCLSEPLTSLCLFRHYLSGHLAWA